MLVRHTKALYFHLFEKKTALYDQRIMWDVSGGMRVYLHRYFGSMTAHNPSKAPHKETVD